LKILSKGVKTLKQRVIGKDKVKATLVVEEDNEAEDLCKYESLADDINLE
jgi:hypothetical protein